MLRSGLEDHAGRGLEMREKDDLADAPWEIKTSSPADQLEKKHLFECMAIPLTGKLYTLAYWTVLNRAQAEDLVQESFLRAWRIFDKFQLGTNFKAWIFKILVLVCKDERRKMVQGQTSLVCPSPLEETAMDGENRDHLNPKKNSERPNLDRARDDLKNALMSLADNQRQVLILISIVEFSYSECATVLDIPRETVMSRLFRARKYLQEERALWGGK